jgi:hydroxymethylpyrimidine pyrophosphatase-like HAD family hydrolase
MNDNQGRSNFDKIIVVDVNPGNDELTKELIIGKFSKVIKNVSSYQHVVLMSHSNLHLLLKLVSDVGLKNGFLISDYGARIYDLKNNRIIYENAIGQTEVNAIVHYGIMQNALVLASGETREYAYSLDQLNAIALQKRHYLPLLYTNDYAKFSKFIHSLPTFSIMLFQKRRTTMLANFEELNHVIKD